MKLTRQQIKVSWPESPVSKNVSSAYCFVCLFFSSQPNALINLLFSCKMQMGFFFSKKCSDKPTLSYLTADSD